MGDLSSERLFVGFIGTFGMAPMLVFRTSSDTEIILYPILLDIALVSCATSFFYTDKFI